MLFALCLSAEAQQPAKVPRIGFLSAFSRSDNNDQLVEAFRQGLREFGYLEGKNIVIAYRYAEGRRERLPDLAAELVRSKVDIIVATTAPGIEAGKTATKIIPIVMVAIGRNPVEAGLVDSLARPGGNVTGMTSLGAAISGKRLELFKEILPKISRVALLYDPANQGNVSTSKEVQKAAHPLGLTIQSIEVRSMDDFERVFAALKKDRPDGLYVSGGQLTNAKDKLI